MKQIFDNVSARCSKLITNEYSTSFSLGIKFLAGRFHNPIYNIYGFVRCADEIVDSFHDFDKEYLLKKYKADALEAINLKISTNPVLNSFQETVHAYKIEPELIEWFFQSMEMDLVKSEYNKEKYENYILGSAESVGLMCLRVFTEGDDTKFQELKFYAMKLGSAFQKVNFLRDLGHDINKLDRHYFPGTSGNFTAEDKAMIEKEIDEEFSIALTGIRKLPGGAKRGVYLAYSYYLNLFNKIKRYSVQRVLTERISLPGRKKISVMFNCIVKEKLIGI